MTSENAPNSSNMLAELHDHVYGKGDPLDYLRPLNSNTGLLMSIPANFAVTTWLTTTGSIGPQYVITAPLLAAGGTLLAYGGAAAAHRVARGKTERQEAEQIALREALDEPVDLFQTGSRKKDRSTLLRWYGTDGLTRPAADTEAITEDTEVAEVPLTDADKSRLIGRFGRLLDAIEQTPIAQIALATNWMTTGENAVDPATYGEVDDNEHFVDRLDKQKRLNVHDMSVEEPLLITTPTRARQLLGELQQSTKVTLHHRLLEHIKTDPDSGIPAMYAEWATAGHSRDTSVALTRRIQTELERTLSLNNTPEYLLEKDTEWGILYKHKTSPMLTVRGDMVSMSEGYHDHSGLASSHYQGQKSLLSKFGFSRADQLIEKLTTLPEGEHDSLLAKVALLLKLHADEESIAHATANKRSDSSASETDAATLLERIIDEPPHRRGNTLRRLEKQGREPTIEYSPRRSKVTRFLGAVGIIAATTLSGAVTGTAMHQGAMATYAQSKVDFKAEYGIDNYAAGADPLYRDFLDNRPVVIRTFEDSVFALSNAQYDLEEQVTVLGNNIGLSGLLTSLGASPFAGTDFHGIGPEYAYTESGGTPIGDVSPNSPNTPVYHIQPMGTATAEGYWASEVDDQLSLSSAGGYPFVDAGLEFIDSMQYYGSLELAEPTVLNLPQSPEEMSAVQFKVSTEFASTGRYLPLVVKNGMTPVAVQMSFQNTAGESIVVSPQVKHDTDSNTYLASYAEKADDNADSAVTLTYWLAATDEQVNARGPLMITDTVDMPAVQAATKQALGLAASASDDEVLAATRGKQYQLDPFGSAQSRAIETGLPGTYDQDITGALTVVGTSLASNDGANCNISVAEYTLATGGLYHGEAANVVNGFRNDGDNVLSVREAHAWIVDTKGTIVDATPTNGTAAYTDPENTGPEAGRTNLLATIVEKGLPPLGLAGIGVMLFKRRRIIARELGRSRVHAAVTDIHAPRAITALQYAEWQPDNTEQSEPLRFDTGPATDPQHEALESRPIEARAAQLANLKYRDAKQKMEDKNITVSRRVRRAIKRVLRNQAGIAAGADLTI